MTDNIHKVLVYGGRDYADTVRVDLVLSGFLNAYGQFAVIEGGPNDRLGRLWARAHGLPVLTVDADWLNYRKGAGHVRNGWMLTYAQPTYAIGFPGGAGTADMTARLRAAGIEPWLP